MIEISEDEFDDAVRDALDLIPSDIAGQMSNVVVLVADEPPEDQPGDLLGLYEGTPLTDRDGGWAAGSLPDRITIYRRPLLDWCESRDELVEEVAITVIHEVGHHFGIDDDRLHELGWG